MTLRERHLEVSADTFIYPPDTFVCVDRFGRYFLYTYISTRSIECVGYGVSLLRPGRERKRCGEVSECGPKWAVGRRLGTAASNCT